MTPTATAISSLLLSLGLATCGWRFFEAFKKGVSNATEGSIGKLLTSLFFLAAAYNGILGAGSLILMSNPASAIWVMLASHVVLTLLALLSVHTVYYIFWPETSPKTLLGTISLMGGVGLFHIDTPLQLTTLLIQSGGPSLFIITGSLLGVSLAAILYLFTQLYRRTEARTIKVLSAAVCGLIIASTLNVAIQAVGPYWNLSAHSIGVLEIMLGLVGLGFLISTITTAALRVNILVLIILIAWRIFLSFGLNDNDGTTATTLWSFAIQASAIIGVLYGYKVARANGGIGSNLGRSILAFTAGLFAQILAHNSYFFDLYTNNQIPYPGISDIGYLVSILLYIIGTLFLAKSLGLTLDLQKMKYKKTALLFISLTTTLALWSLLHNYVFDWNQSIKISVDFAYVAIEAIYLALGAYVCYVQRKLGKGSRTGFLVLTLALSAQFVADTIFTLASESGWWKDGSSTDLVYLAAYFLMAIAVIKLDARTKEQFTIEHIYISIPENETPRPRNSYVIYGAISVFAAFLAWWTALYVKFDGNFTRIGVSLWTDTYSIITILGISYGLFSSVKLAKQKNPFFFPLFFFSLGLALQIIAGIIYGFYVNWLEVPIPYPSLADIGWNASTISYIIGSYFLFLLAKKSSHLRTKSAWLILSILILTIFSLTGHTMIIMGYTIDFQNSLKTFLDIIILSLGSIYLGFAISAFIIVRSNTILTKRCILWIIIALCVQHIADSNFVYQVSQESWTDGDFGDLLLFSAYFLTTIAIIKLNRTTTPGKNNLSIKTKAIPNTPTGHIYVSDASYLQVGTTKNSSRLSEE